MAMWFPVLISENRRSRLPIHVRPDAFRSHSLGSPLTVGTCHVSHEFPSLTVYAMRLPSGEKTGLIFGRASFVRAIGSPSGRTLRYSCPDDTNVLEPRINASMRPSGDRAGCVTESRFVSCTQSDRLACACRSTRDEP